MKEDDDDLRSDLDFELPEMEPEPEPEPLPTPQSPEDLKAALAQERFLELRGDEQFELVTADMGAGHQMMDAGLLEEYFGKHVAVLQRQLVGADEDPARLRAEVSKQYAVHPNRVGIIFFDDGM